MTQSLSATILNAAAEAKVPVCNPPNKAHCGLKTSHVSWKSRPLEFEYCSDAVSEILLKDQGPPRECVKLYDFAYVRRNKIDEILLHIHFKSQAGLDF
jgi:hypothetical protein